MNWRDFKKDPPPQGDFVIGVNMQRRYLAIGAMVGPEFVLIDYDGIGRDMGFYPTHWAEIDDLPSG